MRMLVAYTIVPLNVSTCGVRRFLDARFSVEELANLFPEEEDLIEELGDASPG